MCWHCGVWVSCNDSSSGADGERAGSDGAAEKVQVLVGILVGL